MQSGLQTVKSMPIDAVAHFRSAAEGSAFSQTLVIPNNLGSGSQDDFEDKRKRVVGFFKTNNYLHQQWKGLFSGDTSSGGIRAVTSLADLQDVCGAMKCKLCFSSH